METCDLTDSIRNIYLSHHKEKTLSHVEAVARTTVRLAEIHGLDPRRVRLAALLHDISAIMTPQEMYETAKARGMRLDPAEEKYHFLLHQRISRIIANEQLGIEDRDILSAIECHTTLKKNAKPYDQAVFIADKISWDQEGAPPYEKELTRLAEESLEAACRFYINYQFDHHLLLMPHRWMTEAYEDLNSNGQNDEQPDGSEQND